MTIEQIPPGLILIAAGLLLPLFPRALRPVLILIAPLSTLAQVWSLPDGMSLALPYLGYELVPLASDALSRVFATVFAIAAFAGGLYALNQRNVVEMAAAFVYAGGAIGVCFAGDLITLFVFWEVMAIASTIVVMMGGDRAQNPGLRYAVIHFLGGVLFMAGIAGHVAETGTIAIVSMQADSVATWAIMIAILVNAAAFPFAAWLPDAYPASSWSGMVFLSAFTTKTSVYALIRFFPGEEALIPIGLVMVIYGILMAIIENDIRRILAYSICSQVGFMVTAVGIGTPMTLNGAAAHAFAHILYKALLLMSAGSVIYMTGKHKVTDLGGLFRTMPVACVCGIVGALSISAFPLTSGFVAKSLISSGAGYEELETVWLVLSAASACAFLYVGLTYPWFVFFGKDSGLRPSDPPWNMQAAMILLAILCIGIGAFYSPLYSMLPHEVKYDPYKLELVVQQLQFLLFAGLAFFLLRGYLARTDTRTLDLDWLWRRGGPVVIAWCGSWMGPLWRLVSETWYGYVRGIVAGLYRTHGPESALAKTRPSGAMALWMAGLLGVFILLSFV